MEFEFEDCTIDQPVETQENAYWFEEGILIGLGVADSEGNMNPVEYMTALGLAIGHCVSSMETMHADLNNYKKYFEEAFKQSYKHFKKHPGEAFPEPGDPTKQALIMSINDLRNSTK